MGQDDEGLLPETSGRRIFEGMSDEELLSWLTEMFVAADTDNNGVSHVVLFSAVFRLW